MTEIIRDNSTWKVRRFQSGDAPSIRHLIELVWHEHFHDHPDSFVRDFIYSRLSDVDEAERIYCAGSVFLCAIAGNEVIGTGAIRKIDDRDCEMVRMFVSSNCRGRGVGQSIANELVKFAIQARYDRVRLSSNIVLTASHRLYEKIGFRSVLPWEAGGEAHSRYFVLSLLNG